jgi:hypothetical protein
MRSVQIGEWMRYLLASEELAAWRESVRMGGDASEGLVGGAIGRLGMSKIDRTLVLRLRSLGSIMFGDFSWACGESTLQDIVSLTKSGTLQLQLS